ncbi:tetratricopeptide repeat protein 39C-like [Phymastichus coffea]|uniref:tetratricopeptide repeat protein 39C-like n=1 Tax=Phymastichus coffea TaxID=108790 RepID=UPI00273B7F15|nr:tetratricopeptide repeat protein 39C-like [Phymastichus coffea]
MASSKSEADWSLARKGISLLLNNQTEEAESLFTQYPKSFHMKAGRSFVFFMNALMTFEDDKLQQAVQLLRDMERECAGDIGWLRSMKTRVFGEDTSDSEYVRKLERQVVLADSQVCAALLTLLQQEITGYVRGGWMLRKAWRVYQHAYNQILQLYRRTFGNNPSGFHSMCNTPAGNGSPPSQLQSPSASEWSVPSCNGISSPEPSASPAGLRSSLSMLFTFAGITSEQPTPFIEPSEVIRLMSAISFGYGIFQLCVSLLPPSLTKVIHFLGFEGDRQAGLTSLMYSRLSDDMRAPLATLALLWYHTIVRPFFALDGSNVKAGVDVAKELIRESQPEFKDSALFLFFMGRVERLQSNVNGALRAYEKAVALSTQREVKLLCLHEVAWCHLIRLNYEDAHTSLTKLQEQSRWSTSFYAYLAAVCSGAEGKTEQLLATHKKLMQCVAVTRETQLGLFISRRSPKLIDENNERAYPPIYYKLLVYELLYLWNALPSCTTQALHSILVECKNSHSKEPMDGLCGLIEGSVYAYLGDKDASVRCYRSCLKRRLPSRDLMDQHISAFALYELGNILSSGINVEEGRCLLHRALSQYKNYDFESRLNVRIHAALKKEESPMSYQSECTYGMGYCPTQVNNCRKYAWYCKFIKPFFMFAVSVMLALSVSDLSEKYSFAKSIQTIRSDLSVLRNNLDIISNEVRTLKETRDEFRGRMKETICVIPKLSEAIIELRNELSEGMSEHTRKLMEIMSPERIKQIVRNELQSYDADKTGMADYALESSGGAILSTRDTETYSAGVSVLKLFGIPFCRQQNTPRAIIQRRVLPGECWAIKGSQGSVVIQLFGSVRISGVSLEHISPMISPTGDTTSAPRDFSIWGLLNAGDKNGNLLGRFKYDNFGPSLQYFEMDRICDTPYKIVELKIHSNSGNDKYTCIYRIRVHGNLVSYEEIPS